MASLANNHSEDDEERVAEAIDDIITHFIQVDNLGENEQDDAAAHADDQNQFSDLATMDDTDSPAAFTARLQDVAFVHGATAAIPKCRFGKSFDGVMVDTGAARGSSAGEAQYHAHCNFVGTQPNLDKSRAAVCHFGISSTKSKGVAPVTFPVGDIFLTFKVHVVDADTPILLSIDDMDSLGIYLNSLEDNLIHAESGLKAPIAQVHGHPFIQ